LTALRQFLLLGIWLLAIAASGWVVDRHLVVGTDLRLFMPSPRTAEERLILEEIGESPASRLLLLSISGGEPPALAETSRDLARMLRQSREFRFVANGEVDVSSIPEGLLTYRYLLSPTLDDTRFDAGFLTAALQERVRDLSSPAAGFLEPWLPRDPTLELLRLAETWLPATQPQLQYDVWFDTTSRKALLAVETRAAGFDPQGQRTVADLIRHAFDSARSEPGLELQVTGPGAFSVLMQQKTRDEAQRFGAAATFGMVALLLLAYRSVPVLILGLLPLVSAGVAGLAAVSLVFGTVHGITLAFGFTLIGVAQDYPMHLFSHQRPGLDPWTNVRQLWPTLATGVASTCVAYLAFLLSGVGGLAQLSVFTITGLAVAGLSTRFLLPALVPGRTRDPADSAALGRLWNAIAELPRPLWLGAAVTIACLAYLWVSPRPLWVDELGGLTPVPRALIDQDSRLRRELGAPDVRYMLALEATGAQQVLEMSRALAPRLDELVSRGAIAGFEHPARYLPPAAVQERRRDALPAAAELRTALDVALAGTPFKPSVFEPFLTDVEHARQLPPLGPDDLAGTPLESRVGSLLLKRDEGWIGLVMLSGVADAAVVRQIAASVPGVIFLDLKQASEDLVARQRQRILWCLAGSAALLVVVVTAALRRARRVVRVLAPMALTTLLVLSLLHGLGISLSLFHLIALVLAAGLGLDYALFFEHAADDQGEQRRTLHAVLVCSISTLMVFALLSFSTLPVLKAIGITVAVGVLCNFVLALLLTRPGDT
jgi:predicted exporter